MTDIATNEPKQLRAGLTWQWRREDLAADYPAFDWSLKYWFKKDDGSANFSIDASADGDVFSIDVAPATTQGYNAGDYTWAAVVTDGSDSFEVDEGTLTVLPRYDQAANLDDRTHAKKMVDLLRAAIEGLNLGMKSYTIGTRIYLKEDMSELRKMLQYYEDRLAGEEAAEALRNGTGIGRKIQVRL